MAEPAPLSHEDLLLWPHDHIGCVVGVSVIVEFSSMMEPVLVAVPGTLRHHTSINAPGTELAGRSGDEIVGVYLIDTGPPGATVGYVTFNVSDLGEFPALTTGDGGVAITIGPGVALTIREAD